MADLARCALASDDALSFPRRRFRRPARRSRESRVGAATEALALLVGAGNHRRSLPHGNGGRPAVYGHPVADFTPARLVAVGAEGKGEALAEAALAVMAEFKPQHTLVEIAPCGLPLDPDSRRRLLENRDQYAARRNCSTAALSTRSFERVHDGR
ncbi:MAG: hypothetical protein ACLTSX_13430 [Collinsella sp.]